MHLPVGVREPWFKERPQSIRVDQLLHSVFTYGFSDVLAVMLAQELSRDQSAALELLDRDNPSRAYYMQYILERMETVGRAEFTGDQDVDISG
jgi:hypothetical protein